jgi:DNA polymerase-1
MRAAINAPLQGSAADIIKLAMIRIDEMLTKEYPDAHLILQIHDELLIEAKDRGDAENAKLQTAIQNTMESVMDLSVPLKVDVGSGRNWQESQG